MRAILFERKMINQGTAGDAFQKKLTVNDYRFFGTFCIQNRQAANAAQAITRHHATGGLHLIGLCYTLGRRSCLSVRNVDNYAKTKAP